MRLIRNLQFLCPLYEVYGGRLRPAVIILTFNSAETISSTLHRVRSLTDEIIIVDSGSTDETIQMATELGAFVVSHPFENYGAQRNWAIDNLEITKSWQLHLDAEEMYRRIWFERLKRFLKRRPWMDISSHVI